MDSPRDMLTASEGTSLTDSLLIFTHTHKKNISKEIVTSFYYSQKKIFKVQARASQRKLSQVFITLKNVFKVQARASRRS